MKLSILFIATITSLSTASALPPHSIKGSPTVEARAAPSCANPVPNTCTFYSDCLEDKLHCGNSGYPIGYGLHYCTLFSAAANRMSAAGKAWVTNTMLCLQGALVPFGTAGTESTTCPNLKTFAFGTHPSCYVQSGVCKLPPSDWVVIVGTVSLKELFGSLDALKATFKTAKGCAEFYAWLIKQGIITVVDDVVDAAKDVWDKVTSWF